MSRLVAMALLVGLVAGTGGALAQSDGVTLSLSTYRNVNRVLVLVFSGSVSSGAAGEDVEVVGRDCGGQGFRLISGAETRSGGGWQVENPSGTPTQRWTPVGSGMTFLARWKGQQSDPVVFRIPANIWARKAPGRAWEVHVVPEAGTLSMAGKVVELQRRVGTRWVRYRQARLMRKASFELGAFNHQAVFEVARRGLRLRAFLPRKTALPCYQPAVTKPWRT